VAVSLHLLFICRPKHAVTHMSTLPAAALCDILLHVHVFVYCGDGRSEQAAVPTISPSKVHPFALLSRNTDKRKLTASKGIFVNQKRGKVEIKKSVPKKQLSCSENRETAESRDEKMEVQKFVFCNDRFVIPNQWKVELNLWNVPAELSRRVPIKMAVRKSECLWSLLIDWAAKQNVLPLQLVLQF